LGSVQSRVKEGVCVLWNTKYDKVVGVVRTGNGWRTYATLFINVNTKQINDALRVLHDAGLSARDVAAAYGTLVEPTPTMRPPDADTRYTLPDVPPTTAEHFIGGAAQGLSASVLWPGFSYTLSKGQRALMREAYGMTPTATVTCVDVERWPGTQHPCRVSFKSDVHVDPRLRRAVLTHVTITHVGDFFAQAAELDEEARRERVFGLTPATLTLGRVFDLESVERWAVEDLSLIHI
jgi:hypothetical protein